MLQNILNFIMGNAWLVIIIGVGLFNFVVRLAQKTNEQRAKREALHDMQAQKQESLRTGRPIPSAQPQAKPAQDDRRDRIERLRQERMEQLRALREKRAGATPQAGPATASPSMIPQNRPRPTPIPVQTQPRPQRVSQPRPQQARPQQPAQRRTPLPQAGHSQRPNRPTIIATPQPAPSERRRQRPAQQAAAARNPQRVQRTNPKDSRHAGHVESLREAKNPSLHDSIHTSRPLEASQSARSMLRSRASIRQAIVLNEILDQPVALRDQDIASGSLFS